MFEFEDLEWVEEIEDWIDPLEPYYNPPSLASEWDDFYDAVSDIDDGWDQIPDEVTRYVEKYKNTIRARPAPGRAFRGVREVSEYSHSLSDEMVQIFRPVWDSEEYARLTSAQRARVLRYRMAPAVTRTYDKIGGISREVMTDTLKDKGLVFEAARPLVSPALYRLKNIISKTVDFDVVNDEFQKGWSTFEGGTRNIVELANRQVVLQTSELVDSFTGEPLEGMRLNHHPDACDFCKSVINEGFSLDSRPENVEHLRFHDNCRCVVEIV